MRINRVCCFLSVCLLVYLCLCLCLSVVVLVCLVVFSFHQVPGLVLHVCGLGLMGDCLVDWS